MVFSTKSQTHFDVEFRTTVLRVSSRTIWISSRNKQRLQREEEHASVAPHIYSFTCSQRYWQLLSDERWRRQRIKEAWLMKGKCVLIDNPLFRWNTCLEHKVNYTNDACFILTRRAHIHRCNDIGLCTNRERCQSREMKWDPSKEP